MTNQLVTESGLNDIKELEDLIKLTSKNCYNPLRSKAIQLIVNLTVRKLQSLHYFLSHIRKNSTNLNDNEIRAKNHMKVFYSVHLH